MSSRIAFTRPLNDVLACLGTALQVQRQWNNQCKYIEPRSRGGPPGETQRHSSGTGAVVGLRGALKQQP